LLAWLIPKWIAFELMPTKLPHYVLPVYPALALLAGQAAAGAGKAFGSRGTKFNVFLWAVVTLVLAGGIVAASPALQNPVQPAALIAAASGIAMLAVVCRVLRRSGPLLGGVLAVILSVAVLAPVSGRVLPGLTPLWLSREAARTVERIEAKQLNGPARVAAVGYHEPSLVFHTGTGTYLTDAVGGAAFLAGKGFRIAVVADSAEVAFAAAAAEGHLALQKAAEVTGFNYTKGHWVTLRFYTAVEENGETP
jgi:4-amino-4-deoxy-L-arabinose transferase-like glycosyltransferase